MRILAVGAAALLLAVAAAGIWLWLSFRAPALPEPEATDFRIAEATLVNPGWGAVRDVSVSVRNGIVRLNSGVNADAAPLARYDGMYVLPGFVDMHTHLPPDNALQLTGHYGLLYLAHGVTTIRDAGDIDGTAVPAGRRLIEDGAPFPRLVSCGPFVSSGVSVWPNTVRLDAPEEAVEVVSAIAARGHRCVKAYEGLTPELTAALIEAAAASGLQVIGHVPVEYTMEQSGVPDVQHFFGVQPPGTLRGQSVVYRTADWDGVTSARLDDVVRYVVDNGIANTPTLSLLEGYLGYADYPSAAGRMTAYMPALYGNVVWHPEDGLPVYRGIGDKEIAMFRTALGRRAELLRRLSAAGAVLHIGTDSGQPFSAPGHGYWRELRLFERAGIAPERVLAYATTVARNSLGNGSPELADGSPADFLVFARNPAETLDNLDTLRAVVVDGRLYSREALQEALEDRLRHYAAWPLSAIAERTARQALAASASGFK